ncbi:MULTISPECIES: SEC-C metal-binding domain-containing protein [Geobacillus]
MHRNRERSCLNAIQGRPFFENIPRLPPKTGRKDPCGSGKKYKKCCGK